MAPLITTPNASRLWEALTLPLAEWILEAVSDMGYKRMTPVQASTIPEFMRHRDVVVEAVTGSGKTLAYLIPVIERLLRLEEPMKKHHVGAIIISPTRELAAQIHSVLIKLLQFHGPSAAAMRILDETPGNNEEGIESQQEEYPASALKVVPQLLQGGTTSTSEDLRCFLDHSPNLLISTPGRLLELLSSPNVHCPQSSFEVLVLDEADRLLDLGFKEDLQKILGLLPKQRRTGLFSASVSEAVDQLIRIGLRNSKKITVKVRGVDGGEDRRTPSSLQMSYLTLPPSHKLLAISALLSTLTPRPTKTIIFLSTCAMVDYLQHILPSILPTTRDNQPFLLVPLHGKQPSKVREKNFIRFSNAASPAILLTTDVAARGLDIPQVDLVFQLDPPSDAKVFLHRCGRAGRAGRKGLSIVFLLPGREEAEYPGFLERRGTPVSPLTEPPITVTQEEAEAATARMREVALTDRAIHDKAQRALPSWVKAYSKHQASHIFRIAEIDWEDQAKALALLKMPKMPELKCWDGDKSLGLNIDWTGYRYVDKQREKLRQQALKEREEGGGAEKVVGKEKTVLKKGEKRAWSDKVEQQEERQKRREKKQARREQEKWAAMTPGEKEEKRKLESMIEEVKKRTREDEQLEEFDGFDD